MQKRSYDDEASGIKRYEEEQGYGKWFNQLFALLKTRDSCLPDQGIEHNISSAGKTSDSQELFVLVQAKRKNIKKESKFDEWMAMMKSIVDSNLMSDFSKICQRGN